MPLWYETDNSLTVLYRHSCLHAVFRSCCARGGGRVWMWLSGFHVCFCVRSRDREVQGAKVSERTWINNYMDTKTARERKRMSDVKEVVEAPPEGLLLSVSFTHSSLTNCLVEWPGESEETPFYIWLCICIYFSFPSSFHFLTPAQPSSRLRSSFAAPRCLCAIIWSSLKDFPYLLNCWMDVYPFGEIFAFLLPVRWEDWPPACLHAKYKAETSRWLV